MVWDDTERPNDTRRGIERHGHQHHTDGDDPVTGILKQEPEFATAAGQNLNSVSPAVIVSITITVTAGTIVLLGTAVLQETKTASADYVHTLYLYRDGDLLATNTARGTTVGANVIYSPIPMVYVDSPTTGRHTYSLRGLYNAGSTSGTPVADGRLAAMEFGT